ncbi:MAG TPA: hypothetical protein VGM87_02665 [Roseomonas sp.]|jgi:hypothetical protein
MPFIRAPKRLLLAWLVVSLLASGAALAQAPGALPPPLTPPATVAPTPADEDPAIRQLRVLLGPDIRLEYRSAAVTDAAAGNFRLDDVQLHGADFRAVIGTLTATGQRGDGAQTLALHAVGWYGNDGTLLSVNDIQLAGLAIQHPAADQAVTAAALIGAVRFDRLAIEGAAFGLGEVSLGRLTVEGYGPGRETRVLAENFEGQWAGDGPNGFSLARLGMNGLDLATVMLLQVTETPSGPARMQGTMLAETFALTENGAVVGGAESLRFDTAIEVTADGRITEIDRGVLRGLQLDGVQAAQAFLSPLGYTALPAEITTESRMERQGRRSTITDAGIAVPGFGRLSFGFDVDGLDPAAPPLQAMTQIQLRGVTLGYRDDGLLPRALQAQAEVQHISVPALRAQLIASVAGALEGPTLAALLTPIKRFLSGQAQALEVTARPPQPLGFDALAPGPDGMEEVLARLGLAATAH